MSNTQVGREPVQIVEIVQPSCVNRFGVAPCTATAPVGEECFNTRNTCGDPANYNSSGSLTWRFMKAVQGYNPDIYEENGDDFKALAIPSVVQVSTNATELNAGGNNTNLSPLGRRSSVTITLNDHSYDDLFGDFYIGTRNYIATDQSTFWRKWLVRNPYYNGWTLNVYNGYIGEDLSSMQKLTYVLEEIDGPSASGVVRITARDPLRLADDKRAQAPRASDLNLLAGINDTTTAIGFNGNLDELDQVLGNDGLFYIAIEKEIISYTSRTGGVLNGVVRGALDTVADSHPQFEQAQRVIHYENANGWDIANDLLTDFTTIDPAFIDYAGWVTEGTTYLSTNNFTGTIVKPTTVTKLLGEIGQDYPAFFYWDERDSLIKFKAVRPEIGTIPLVSDDGNLIGSQWKKSDKQNQRITRVIFQYQKRDPFGSETDFDNYAIRYIRADLGAENKDAHGDIRALTISSRWIRNETDAQVAAIRLLQRYVTTPEVATIKLDVKDRDIFTASVIDIDTRNDVDQFGNSVIRRWQVISATEMHTDGMMDYMVQRFEYTALYGVYSPDDADDYDNANDADKATYAYYADDNGLLPDGKEGYKYF
jgi:hypothetical protein